MAVSSDNLRMTKIPLHDGAGEMPALGFGTLIPDPAVTITATEPHSRPDSVTSIARNATATSAK